MHEEEDQTGQAIAAARQALGLQLAALRRAAGYSQKDFAPLTGYRRGTLANVETGRQNAPRVFWERCAQALGAGVLLTAYDQIQAMVTAHRQETARRVQAASDAMIRARQDSWHRDTASYAVQLMALPAPRQADEVHICCCFAVLRLPWWEWPTGCEQANVFADFAGVLVAAVAVLIGWPGRGSIGGVCTASCEEIRRCFLT